MPIVIQHCCKHITRDNDKPKVGSHNYLYQRGQDGVWCLYDSGKVIGEKYRYCDWCKVDLTTLGKAMHVDTTAPHRCQKMAQVERRRNEEKAHHQGDRSYCIRWLPESGWTLLNKGEATKRVKLH